MNNPLLYPFLAICIVFAVAFAVWCYFTLRDRKLAKRIAGAVVKQMELDMAYQRKLVEVSQSLADSIVNKPAEPYRDDAQGQPSYGAPLYRHRGHRHAKRPPNRADQRAADRKLFGAILCDADLSPIPELSSLSSRSRES